MLHPKTATGTPGSNSTKEYCAMNLTSILYLGFSVFLYI